MRLFLYGTLMQASDTSMARWLGQRLGDPMPGTVPGRMVAIPGRTGWFPALIPGSGAIRGVVCDADLGPGDLPRLDRYEGREYRRQSLRVRTAEGSLNAQAWIWRIAVPRDGVPIAGGDFLDWLRTSRRPILSSRNGT